MDTVLYILDSIQSRGMSTGNISPTSSLVQDPMSIDLMKCWQEDVDACTVEDGSMLTVYDGMPEEELKNNFIHWQVKNYEHHSKTRSSQEYISYSLNRGNNQLREVLHIYKNPSDNTVWPGGITFNTNQRLLARQIFERLKKNLSALYKEQPWNADGTSFLYSTYDHYMVGYLTLHNDYKKEAYSVTWTGMSLAD